MRRVALAVAIAGALVLAGCSDKPEVVHLYDRVPVPAVPDRTADVPAGDGALPDGQYWGVDAAASGGSLSITLQQAFFGSTCTSILGADQCTGDIGVKADPSRTVTLDSTALAALTPLSVSAKNRQNYAIDGKELVSLIGGGKPDTPPTLEFAYQPYPFLVTIDGGTVTGLQQIWVDG